jgi:hypothetical protein
LLAAVLLLARLCCELIGPVVGLPLIAELLLSWGISPMGASALIMRRWVSMGVWLLVCMVLSRC